MSGKKLGRPSSYNSEIADEICEAIARGGALYRICDETPHYPDEATVYRWIDSIDEFRVKYIRARERQQHFCADEIIEIADTDDDPARARNRILARQWRASKLARKTYGDKVDVDATVQGNLTVVTGVPERDPGK